MVRASFLDRHNIIAQSPEPERTNAAVQYHVLPTASSPLTPPPSHSSCESLSTSHTDYLITILHCTLSQYNLAESSHQKSESMSTSPITQQRTTPQPSAPAANSGRQAAVYTRTAGSVSTTGRTVLTTKCFSSNHSYFLLIPAYRISVAVFVPNTTPNAETNAIAAAAAVSGASASKIRPV